MWETPVYKLRTKKGKPIEVDVTLSCSAGLGPNDAIFKVAQFFKRKGVRTILDFGAGALRHTFPLLRHGFSVCAVEFEDQFRHDKCRKALARARKEGGFTELIFPKPFIIDRKKFDAALLCFVLPTMPRATERMTLLNLIQKKLTATSYIFWMSQFGKYESLKTKDNEVEDGWFFQPKWTRHTFYYESRNADIDAMLNRIGFDLIKPLGESGHDQFRLYSRGGGTYP